MTLDGESIPIQTAPPASVSGATIVRTILKAMEAIKPPVLAFTEAAPADQLLCFRGDAEQGRRPLILAHPSHRAVIAAAITAGTLEIELLK